MNGFSLLELMIVLAIMGILAAIFISASNKDISDYNKHTIITDEKSYKIQIRCVEGYKFIYGMYEYTQILDSNGRGIPCQ